MTVELKKYAFKLDGNHWQDGINYCKGDVVLSDSELDVTHNTPEKKKFTRLTDAEYQTYLVKLGAGEVENKSQPHNRMLEKTNGPVPDPMIPKPSVEKPNVDSATQEELKNMSVSDLKIYAEEWEIDIGNANTKADILKKIQAAL